MATFAFIATHDGYHTITFYVPELHEWAGLSKQYHRYFDAESTILAVGWKLVPPPMSGSHPPTHADYEGR